jgi:hypothetical protein
MGELLRCMTCGNESKLRAIFWYNSLANPFNRGEKDD